jgi:hypothetical protein
MTREPARTIGRRIIDVAIKAFGLVAAVAGIYFAFLTIQTVVTVLEMAVKNPPMTAGLGAPALAIVEMFDIIFIFVFGFAAGICLTIGAWILEPSDRWRRWRLQRQADLSPPAADD